MFSLYVQLGIPATWSWARRRADSCQKWTWRKYLRNEFFRPKVKESPKRGRSRLVLIDRGHEWRRKLAGWAWALKICVLLSSRAQCRCLHHSKSTIKQRGVTILIQWNVSHRLFALSMVEAITAASWRRCFLLLSERRGKILWFLSWICINRFLNRRFNFSFNCCRLFFFLYFIGIERKWCMYNCRCGLISWLCDDWRADWLLFFFDEIEGILEGDFCVSGEVRLPFEVIRMQSDINN